MYFTLEDYRKMEKWFQKSFVKDSEFEKASPLNGEEEVAIVQNGKNRKIKVEKLISQISNLNTTSDFINITTSYGESNISLKEAISLIPSQSRKEGQLITYLNKDNNWEIYQFQGAITQWNNTNLWKSLYTISGDSTDDIDNKLASLEFKINNKIASINSSISTLTSTTSSLSGRLSAAENDIDNLQSQNPGSGESSTNITVEGEVLIIS